MAIISTFFDLQLKYFYASNMHMILILVGLDLRFSLLAVFTSFYGSNFVFRMYEYWNWKLSTTLLCSGSIYVRWLYFLLFLLFTVWKAQSRLAIHILTFCFVLEIWKSCLKWNPCLLNCLIHKISTFLLSSVFWHQICTKLVVHVLSSTLSWKHIDTYSF